MVILSGKEIKSSPNSYQQEAGLALLEDSLSKQFLQHHNRMNTFADHSR
jgi:hypothetical protein